MIRIKSQFRIIQARVVPLLRQPQLIQPPKRQRTRHCSHWTVCSLTSLWKSQQRQASRYKPQLHQFRERKQLHQLQLRELQVLLHRLRVLQWMQLHLLAKARPNFRLSKLLIKCLQSNYNSSKPKEQCLARTKSCKPCHRTSTLTHNHLH